MMRLLTILAVFWLAGCHRPKAFDLMDVPSSGYALDPSGQSQNPLATEFFAKRLDISPSLPREAKVWLQYDLPEDERLSRLYVRRCQNIKAIYQENQALLPPHQNTLTESSFIPLSSVHRPARLFIQVELSRSGSFTLECERLILTTPNHAIWYYMTESAPLFASGLIIIALGFTALAMNLAFFSLPLLTFGFFTFSAGLLTLSGVDFPSSPGLRLEVWRSTGPFICFAFYMLFFIRVTEQPRLMTSLIAGCNFLLGLGTLAVQFVAPAFFASSLEPLIPIILGVDIFFVMGLTLEATTRRRPFAKPLAWSSGTLAAAAAFDWSISTFAHSRILLSPWIFLALVSISITLLLRRNLRREERQDQVRSANLKKRRVELQSEVDRRTETLRVRSRQLESSHIALEEKVDVLTSQQVLAAEVVQQKEDILSQLSTISETLLPALKKLLERSQEQPEDLAAMQEKLSDIQHRFSDIEVDETPDRPEALIDVLTANKRHQRTFRSAVGGARIQLRIAENLEQLLALQTSSIAQLIIVDDTDIDALPAIHESNTGALIVAFSEKGSADALGYHQLYPMLDQVFTLDLPKNVLQKLLLTHLSKLISGDVFGAEKYLGWGTSVQEKALDIRGDGGRSTPTLASLDELSLQPEQKILAQKLATHLLEIRNAQLLTGGNFETQELQQIRYAHDAHVLALSVDLPGHLLAKQDILRLFRCEDETGERGAGALLLQKCHAVILNSDGRKRHELVVLGFLGQDELPPAFFYPFIMDS